MKVTSAAAAQPILLIDIVGTGIKTISLAISPSLFRTDNEWQLFSIPIQIPANAASIEVRGIYFHPGITDLYLDYINILPGDLRGFYSGEFTITPKGSVGIGAINPVHKLDVNGDAAINGTLILPNGNLYSDANNMAYFHNGGFIWANNCNTSVKMELTSQSDLFLHGTMFVGSNNNQKGLDVNGNIKTRKIKVTQTDWADYVFDSSYQLPSLSHVETFIQQNKHLPEVPSAAEVKKDGLDLGDNQAVLLKKIEELTLYIIDQNKHLSQQPKKIENMEKQIAELKVDQRNSNKR